MWYSAPTRPERWLRGPVPGVPPLRQPVAHALLQAADDVRQAAGALSHTQLAASPGGAASVGFHLRHAAGSLDRLFTYARGEPLSDAQRAFLAAEAEPGGPPDDAHTLVAVFEAAVDRALAQLRATPQDTLLEPRGVGRAQLPSTVLGLLMHAAEQYAAARGADRHHRADRARGRRGLTRARVSRDLAVHLPPAAERAPRPCRTPEPAAAVHVPLSPPRSVSLRRPQSLGEEIANSITHGFGLLASLAALPVLVIAALARRDPWEVVGAAAFGVALVLCYGASTLYHAVHAPRAPNAKRRLRILDHATIFLLIAGTYTPFTLGVLRGPVGWSLFTAVWTLALLGITAKLTVGVRFPRLSTALYLAMGWLVVFAIQPLAANVGAAGLAWLVSGGLAYTAGVAFYALDARLRYGHAVWHLFVAAGSTCHFVAVLRYAGAVGA